MPDKRTHRGPHPADAKLFAPAAIANLKLALADFSLLLTKGYAEKSALKLVGDRFSLTQRQRLAIMRSACSDQQLTSRKQRQVELADIVGVAVLHKNYPDIKVYIHQLDAKMLTGAKSNLAVLGRLFSTEPGPCGRGGDEPADFTVEDGSIIEQAGIKLRVLHIPGHTPGGICLYSEDEGIVFTNDTLFADGVGRTDLPGGNMAQLMKSIKEKLCILPDETIVYPGHGPQTTIAQEKAHNPYLQ